MNVYRIFPTLDMCVDVKAKDEDEAIRKVSKATDKIIADCCDKLRKLNHFEGGCDFTYGTDSWPLEESDWQEGEIYPPLLPEPMEKI